MIEKTEAIVLRSVKYQESSLISTLFTEQLGRVSVPSKRRTKNTSARKEVKFNHK